jgi:glycosyltransferase involved in cell wall biosynthesis
VKINLFSPLPPLRSDIARLTTNLVPLLSAKAEVVVWSSEPKWEFEPPSGVRVRHYEVKHPPWREISEADVTFYQMGNDPRYHHAIWQISRQHPGIVILHDIMLQHFFSGLVFHDAGLNRREYLELVERYHGLKGRVAAETHLNGLLSTEELAQICPLTEAAIENALAVVVHSESAFTALPADASVALLQLCVGACLPDLTSVKSRSPTEPYRITMFGFLGPNRRLPTLLRALAKFERRDRFRLDVYGTMEGAEKMEQLIGRLGLNESVRLHGFVDAGALDAALRTTDLAANLRDPSMGEASGSQLHLWQYALPSLVTNKAWYATLPANTVAFVRPGHEIEDIHKHLTAFLAEPEKYRALGRNGREYVAGNHSIERYASELLELAEHSLDFRARWIARDLAQHAASTINEWSEAATAATLARNVTEQIRYLTASSFVPNAVKAGAISTASINPLN